MSKTEEDALLGACMQHIDRMAKESAGIANAQRRRAVRTAMIGLRRRLIGLRQGGRLAAGEAEKLLGMLEDGISAVASPIKKPLLEAVYGELAVDIRRLVQLRGVTGAGPKGTVPAQPVFTRYVLAREYNGTGGRPAYIAVRGLVYDVSHLPAWSGGIYEGLLAGKDHTETARENERMFSKMLSKAKMVGRLDEPLV